VPEQRQRFLEDYKLRYYSITELAERFDISRKTAHKWIDRFERHGQAGYLEHSRRPHSCPLADGPGHRPGTFVRLREIHPTGAPASCST